MINRISNLIIVYHLFSDEQGTHISYYNEKCRKYLGYIPDGSIMFRGDDGRFLSDRRVFSDMINMLLESGGFDKVSGYNNIMEHKMYGGIEYRIPGVHNNLVSVIMRDIESIKTQPIGKEILRSIKIHMIMD